MSPPDGRPGTLKPFVQSTSRAAPTIAGVFVELPDQTKFEACAPTSPVPKVVVPTLKLEPYAKAVESPPRVVTTEEPDCTPVTVAASSK